VQLYLGYGSAPFPRQDAMAVMARFGPEDGARLIERLESLVRDAGDLQPDWKRHSLVSAAEWAERKMKQRHPELNGTALAAFGWAFSYWWK
jgi:hypothetical protein